ncbi:MAG TPA: hypothetical protein PLJ35_01755 [Anaerolineae bacterium]|nr:hypothetical protein [Anaerolineae bacterium]HPL27514.1 hypothetical protein [Anaerolineae bacterium]
MIWHRIAGDRLRDSGLFRDVCVHGAKVRATLDPACFVDVPYDPTTGSYSYALIDLRLPWPGDKRLLGWDDYPHEGITEIEALPGYPHHFQRRAADGAWVYEPSPMRGEIGSDMDFLIQAICAYLQSSCRCAWSHAGSTGERAAGGHLTGLPRPVRCPPAARSPVLRTAVSQ